jgi:hypothetical protein
MSRRGASLTDSSSVDESMSVMYFIFYFLFCFFVVSVAVLERERVA